MKVNKIKLNKVEPLPQLPMFHSVKEKIPERKNFLREVSSYFTGLFRSSRSLDLTMEEWRRLEYRSEFESQPSRERIHYLKLLV